MTEQPLSASSPVRRRALLAAPALLWASAARAELSWTPQTDLPSGPLGRLTLLGGLQLFGLRRSLPGFGGASGLHVADDLTLHAVGDRGGWLRARLQLEDWRPVGLEGLSFGRLQGEGEETLEGLNNADAEALAWDAAQRRWLVAFERSHRLLGYETLGGPGSGHAPPPRPRGIDPNKGLEALAVLGDGRWLTIAENWAHPTVRETKLAWLRSAAGEWTGMAYRPSLKLNPSDATALPDGGALVLERRNARERGVAVRLVELTARQLAAAKAETVLAGEGEPWLQLNPTPQASNFEGVSVFRHRGRTLVALISDENSGPPQRSLLWLLALG